MGVENKIMFEVEGLKFVIKTKHTSHLNESAHGVSLIMQVFKRKFFRI